MMPATYEISSQGDGVATSSPVVIGHSKQVFKLDPLRDPRWGAFVRGHPNGSVFHQVEWLQALKSCYGYDPVALTLSPPGSELENGLVYCEVRSPLTGKRLVSIPFSDHCEPLISDAEELRLFLTHVSKEVGERHWGYFELRPIFHRLDDRKDLGVSQNYYFHRLDLRPSEQELLKKFHKHSIQRKIRRAERESLRYEVGNSERLLHYFYKLLILTRKRQFLPPQPLKWFRTVADCMGNNAQIWVAFKGDVAVAGIFTLTTKKSLIYKYGCSDSRFSNLGGTALLIWNAIQQAKANGLVEFDLGRSDLANIGLITFKEHLGAERSVVNYWRYPVRAASSNPERLVKYAKALISVAPDQILAMLGNLLYRHVG